MSEQFEEILDQAATRLRDGEGFDRVLVSFPAHAPALLPLLEGVAAMASLQPVEMPGRIALAADRRAFLEQAAQLRAKPVSAGPVARLIAWTKQTVLRTDAARTKETRPMFALLAKILVIIAVGVTAAGGTVAAAADSMPDSALYPVKIGVENVRLALASGPAEEAELAMAFVQERVQEMRELALAGEAPSAEVMNRFHEQLQTALRQAAQIEDDEALVGLLQQTRQQIRYQENELLGTQPKVQEQARVRLQQAEEELSAALVAIEEGLANVELYRWRYTHNRPEDAPEQPEMSPLPDPPVQYEQQHRQGQPEEPPAGEQPGQNEAPVQSQEQNGELDRDRQQDRTNQPEGVPAGPQGPVQNQNQQRQGAPAEDPAGQQQQQQNGQNGPSSGAPDPAQVAARTQEQTEAHSGPLTENDCGLLTLYRNQEGPPAEYPEPTMTQEGQQPEEPIQPGAGNP